MVKLQKYSSLTVALFLVSQFLFTACSHKKDVKPFSRNELQSKRVALAKIDGEDASKVHVEVGIVNEILDEGRFEIVDRNTVQDAMITYPDDSDWQRLGRKIGADYIMAVRVLDFKIDERKGYDAVHEEDSVLEEESGEDKPITSTRYVKVKSYDGLVRLKIKFFDVAADKISYEGIGSAEEKLNSRDGELPGKMEMLEKLTRQAVADYFNKMPK